MPSPDWTSPTADGPVDATVALPGSKSLTNRFLVLAALASGISRLRSPLRSRDTLLMAEALRALGVGIEDARRTHDWLVTPATPSATRRSTAAWPARSCGSSRRWPPWPRDRARSTATRRPGSRPMGRCSTPCARWASSVEDDGRGTLPFTVHGTARMPGGAVTLDASASSQFISALLLSGPRYDQGVTVHHDGKPVPSQPHIEMTVETLRDAGADRRRRRRRHLAGRAGRDQRPRRPGRARPVQRRAVPRRGAGDRRPGARARAGRSTRPRPATRSATSSTPWVPTSPWPARPHRSAGTGSRHRRRPARRQRADAGRRRPGRPRRLPHASSAGSPTSAATRPTGWRRWPASSAPSGHRSPRPRTACTSPRPRRAALSPTTFHTYADHRMVMAGAVARARRPRTRRRGRRDRRQDAARVHRPVDRHARAVRDVRDAQPDGASHERLRRVRRPDPPQHAGHPSAVQGPPRPRRRRARLGHRRRPGPLHRPRASPGPATSARPSRMRARELGRKGIVVGDDVFVVGDTSGSPDALARIVRVEPRRTLLRRTADDTDPVERVIVANADQLVVVSRAGQPRAAAADDRPLPRRGLRRRHGPAARAHQGRPRRPCAVPRELRAARGPARRHGDDRGRRDRGARAPCETRCGAG